MDKLDVQQKEIEKYDKLLLEIDDYGGMLIYAHSFYDWVENNINNVSIKLLKAIITNIIPLGDDGRKFFIYVSKQMSGFEKELIKLYDSIEKEYSNGKLRATNYLTLYGLGYDGDSFSGYCPADEVLRHRDNSSN